jgi:hypothetical protein
MMPDYHEQIRDAIGDRVKALYAQDARIRVYVQEQYDPKTSALPCISVTYEAGSETIRDGSNASDYIAYPVLVSMHGFGPVNVPVVRPFPSITEFRNTMREAFNLKRLNPVPEVFQCEYQGQAMLDLALPQYEKLNTAVVITAVATVSRGAS